MVKKEPKKVWIANSWGGREVNLESLAGKKFASPFWKGMTVLLYVFIYLMLVLIFILSPGGTWFKVVSVILISVFFGLLFQKWFFSGKS